ncbi:24936_t:CDS:2, partial [Racocetra persica]
KSLGFIIEHRRNNDSRKWTQLNYEEYGIQLSNAVEKNQKNEIKGLDSVASPLNHEESSEQSTNNSQLNTTKKSSAQNSSFDIEENSTNKNTNFSDDSDASISGQLFNAIEKNQENESHSSVQ